MEISKKYEIYTINEDTVSKETYDQVKLLQDENKKLKNTVKQCETMETSLFISLSELQKIIDDKDNEIKN